MDSINYSTFGGLLNKDTATLARHFRAIFADIIPMNGHQFADAAHYEACKRGNEYEGKKLQLLAKELNDRLQLPEASKRIIREQELTEKVRQMYSPKKAAA